MNQMQAQGLGESTAGLDYLAAIASPVTDAWDYLSVAYPTGTQEVYTFKTGGSGGTTVITLTINYTDSTKENLSDVTAT